ncbi:MAG: endonuclease MutS2 [Campylobacterales bacterium]|nr:endonuclease MutS2 [Campylobacterales bacterium]
MSDTSLVQKLDLANYISTFKKFLARDKAIAMQGDINNHYRYIKELSNLEFQAPKETRAVDIELNRLKKQAFLSLEELFEFVKIIRYFNYLASLTLPHLLREWIDTIKVPEEVMGMIDYFDDVGSIDPLKESELSSIEDALQSNKNAIRESLKKTLNQRSLQEFLVDTQIHYINSEETILVRGGFSGAIKASVMGRSGMGYFYILPQALSKLKDREAELLSKKEAIILRYAREFSSILSKHESFLRFINKEFDRFDNYQARVFFAKAKDYEFILPGKNDKIHLESFKHPALGNPKPVTIDFSKKIMLITGVNAGGKTMLLKSILSSIYMSKYLLPFACDAIKTEIGHFNALDAIIDDPQNVKNDISTFAGRMSEFATLFVKRDMIVGVDEIELGTDSDEAASLFRVVLESLLERNIKFIITTHHKRLASLMAARSDVELIAALYDEERREPTYTFLQGSIGKSYAFETAKRYGIPEYIVTKAIEVHGEDKERLGELIERSSTLELQMRAKLEELERTQEKLEQKNNALNILEDQIKAEHKSELAKMEKIYTEALGKVQDALKVQESKEGRRALNEAHKIKQKATKEQKETNQEPLNVGDSIKYRSYRGEILSLQSKSATILVEGMKMNVPLNELKRSILPKIDQSKERNIKKSKVSVDKNGANISIKLLGMFGDEAIERLDRAISDALVNGISEIEVIHGGGKGILAKLVKEYLLEHPKIKNFYKMQGNLGVTIVEL